MDTKTAIYNATQFIHKMYSTQITVTDIAAASYLSPSYFSFLFRTFTGFTVKNYLNRYRLYRAALDLTGSEKPLTEIAFSNGFSSQQTFTRSFSQMYDITPAQFRIIQPYIECFPLDSLWKKERVLDMEIKKVMDTVEFILKEAFFVIGLESDVYYGQDDGQAIKDEMWKTWFSDEISKSIPDQVTEGLVYGITHGETSESKAKFFLGTEVTTLNNINDGLVGRKFNACMYAVFKIPYDIFMEGSFWMTFYSEWLPGSGYKMFDNKHSAIEIFYSMENKQSIIQIYVPVSKREDLTHG